MNPTITRLLIAAIALTALAFTPTGSDPACVEVEFTLHAYSGPIVGNTPTRVGKTILRTLPAESVEKHPHARGEDTDEHEAAAMEEETPPRAWGRRLCPQDDMGRAVRRIRARPARCRP